MISKQQKKEIIDNLADKLSRQKAVVFFDYTGLSDNQLRELRSQLQEQGIDCQIAKKTLIDLALGKAGFKDVKVKNLAGQIALIFGYQDEILPAKILYNFSKNNNDLKILAGLVQGEYLESEAMINLAKLPSKQELLVKLVSSILSPLSGLVNALQGNTRKLICVLKNMELKA